MPPDPKPFRRQKASRKQWQRIRLEKLLGKPCRICGADAVSLHHLLAKSLRGGDVQENLVPLCGSGTTGCHGKIEAMERESRVALRKNLQPDEVAYLVGVRSEEWLNRKYPEK